MSHLICRTCLTSFSLDVPQWQCHCGGLLDLEWDAPLDRDAIERRAHTMWRYREAIPLPADTVPVSFDEPMTPLVRSRLDGRGVWLKLEQQLPTGSFKDRGASVLVSKIKQLDIPRVVEDSSGNAGSAIAAYCARAGVRCTIFTPESASPEKLAQIRIHGAELVRVPGDRQAAADTALEAAESTYYASHSRNPFFLHGTKTVAFELWEQLAWQAPDTVVVPAGNGTLLLGAWLGFRELLAAGLVQKMPRLVAVQARRCAPLVNQWRRRVGEAEQTETGATVAEGIAVAEPIRLKQMLDAVVGTGGTAIAVGEGEILAAWKQVGALGFYIEPTAAAGIAGLTHYLRQNRREETVVAIVTGHGLKSGHEALRRLR